MSRAEHLATGHARGTAPHRGSKQSGLQAALPGHLEQDTSSWCRPQCVWLGAWTRAWAALEATASEGATKLLLMGGIGVDPFANSSLEAQKVPRVAPVVHASAPLSGAARSRTRSPKRS